MKELQEKINIKKLNKRKLRNKQNKNEKAKHELRIREVEKTNKQLRDMMKQNRLDEREFN